VYAATRFFYVVGTHLTQLSGKQVYYAFWCCCEEGVMRHGLESNMLGWRERVSLRAL